MNSPDFEKNYKLSDGEVLKLLNSDNLKCKNEYEVALFMVKWMDYDK